MGPSAALSMDADESAAKRRRSSIGWPPEPAALAWSAAWLVAGLIAVLVVVLGHRHGIDALEPAVEIDIGAVLGTERTELLHRQLAADRTGRKAGRGIGHRLYLVPVSRPREGRGARPLRAVRSSSSVRNCASVL